MKARDIATTLAGLVGLTATAAAVLSIRLLLASTTAPVGALDGSSEPLQAVARALYFAMAAIVRYL